MKMLKMMNGVIMMIKLLEKKGLEDRMVRHHVIIKNKTSKPMKLQKD